jgi:hypothetical protein
MQSSESRAFAQFGGFLLLVSLVLPYFTFSIAGLSGIDGTSQRLWSIDKGAFVLIAAYGLLALSQIRFSDARETVALIYMIIAAIVTAALIYRIWISPPLSGSEFKVGGVSLRDALKQIGLEWKVGYGAYVAMLGSAFFLIGSFLEWRAAPGAGAVQPVAQPLVHQPPQQYGQQAYAPQPGAQQQVYEPPAQPMAPPDPFAPPAVPGQPAQPAQPTAPPPDPFAPPVAPTQPAAAPPPQTQPPQPPVPPQMPPRPPGS